MTATPAILADSNVYIDIMRSGRNPASVLTSDFDVDDLVTCGMVKLEVLREVRPPKAFQNLSGFFDIQQFVGDDNNLWDESITLARSLSQIGFTLPSQDILIAASAFRAGAAVLTADKHFSMIPHLKVITSPY